MMVDLILYFLIQVVHKFTCRDDAWLEFYIRFNKIIHELTYLFCLYEWHQTQ